MMKSLFAALLCLTMALTLPTAAFAANEQTELDISKGSIVINDYGALIKPRTGEDITYSINPAGYKIIGSSFNTISVEGSLTHTITLSGVNINASAPFVIKSGNTTTVNLILEEDNVLTGAVNNPGLYVPSGAKLTINGTGSLSATGGNYGAGIGGGRKGDCGDVEISSGTITSNGGEAGSAGIGGGYGGNGGTVIISGGTVTATGGGSGAGIGGGAGIEDSSGYGSTVIVSGGNGGRVIISGGTVTANGGGYGAGIGGGYRGDGGDIEISSATVTTIGGGSGGAGIGGGGGYDKSEDYFGRGGNGGTIKISGGAVTATGGEQGGAGIGGGKKGDGGTVTISGGTVTATGGSKSRGAGIGGGDYGNGDNVEISSGTVTASGGPFGGAGIGGGGHCGSGGDIKINGGTVTATGNAGGAGIGGGNDGGSSNTVTISGGTVTATGNSGGAGIGGGANYNGIDPFAGIIIGSSGGTVIINGGNVKAKAIDGGDDIGKGGENGDSGTLKNGGGENVRLVTLTLSPAPDTAIDSLDAGTNEYLMKDVKPLDGKLYFYLPANTTINRLTTDETPQQVFAEEKGKLITIQNNNDNAATLTPVAADLSKVTVSGATGMALAPQSVTITLYKHKFKKLPALTDVSDWFTNMPAGLGATIDSPIEENATTATITFSGTPTQQSADAIEMLLPAEYIADSIAVTVPMNANAKWDIAAPLTSPGNDDDDVSYTPSPVTIYNDAAKPDATVWLTGSGLDNSDMLLTERNPQGSEYSALLKLANSGDVFATYNIHLRSGKKATNSAMHLAFDLNAKYAGQAFTLVHQKADGTYEYFYGTADANGNLSFGPMYELSPFMLVKGRLPQTAFTSLTDAPKTGDSVQPLLWTGAALIIAAALAGTALCRRRRDY